MGLSGIPGSLPGPRERPCWYRTIPTRDPGRRDKAEAMAVFAAVVIDILPVPV